MRSKQLVNLEQALAELQVKDANKETLKVLDKIFVFL